MFQGVGFLCLKLPVVLQYCVKANKQAALHRQFSAHRYCLLTCVILLMLSGIAQISSLDLNPFLTPAYLNLDMNPRSGGQSVVSSTSLLFFSFATIKKKKKIGNKLLHMGYLSFPMILHLC